MKKSESVLWAVEYDYYYEFGKSWRVVGPQLDCHRTKQQALSSLKEWRAMVSEQRLKREYRVSKYVRVD